MEQGKGGERCGSKGQGRSAAREGSVVCSWKKQVEASHELGCSRTGGRNTVLAEEMEVPGHGARMRPTTTTTTTLLLLLLFGTTDGARMGRCMVARMKVGGLQPPRGQATGVDA